MNLSDPIIVALIAFLSAILGGLIQAGLTSARERRAFRWATNRDNYVLFMQAVARKATFRLDGPERTEATRMQIEATARILLQGSPTVVRALDHFQGHGVLNTEEGYANFGRLVEAMRTDVGGETMADFVPVARSTLFERAPEA
jgi:hypothetical protein